MTELPPAPHIWRNRILAVATVVLSCPLLLALLYRVLKEVGKKNQYALVADSFLTQTPWVSACYGADCLFVGDKIFVIFPPFPGVLAIPLVLMNGVETTGFAIIGVALMAGSLFLWNRIFKVQGAFAEARYWLLAAVAFASPLFYVTLRTDGVWFFAQGVAFFFATLAFHEAFVGRRLITAGLALACAVMSRQMSVFLAPLLLLVWMRPDERIFKIDRATLTAALKIGLTVAIGVLGYLAWNYWRFGNIFDTGYRYLKPDAEPLMSRVTDYGVWHPIYAVQNFFYFFIQGFHATFQPPHDVKITGLDPYGTSFLAASPWLLILYFVKREARTFLLLSVPIAITLAMLVYHSNGYSQYNTQRYMLDWMPAILMLLAPTLTRERLDWFRLLVAWGIALNVAAVFVLFLMKTT
jgi:hypothetical protein